MSPSNLGSTASPHLSFCKTVKVAQLLNVDRVTQVKIRKQGNQSAEQGYVNGVMQKLK